MKCRRRPTATTAIYTHIKSQKRFFTTTPLINHRSLSRLQTLSYKKGKNFTAKGKIHHKFSSDIKPSADN